MYSARLGQKIVTSTKAVRLGGFSVFCGQRYGEGSKSQQKMAKRIAVKNDRTRWSRPPKRVAYLHHGMLPTVSITQAYYFRVTTTNASEARPCLFLVLLYAPCLAVSLGAHTSHHVFTCSASALSSGLAATILPCPSRSLPALRKTARLDAFLAHLSPCLVLKLYPSFAVLGRRQLKT
jgi:hypothetical protein